MNAHATDILAAPTVTPAMRAYYRETARRFFSAAMQLRRNARQYQAAAREFRDAGRPDRAIYWTERAKREWAKARDHLTEARCRMDLTHA